MIQQGAKDVHDPLLGLDIQRLEREIQSYEEWLDQRTDEAYKIAEVARSANSVQLEPFQYSVFVDAPGFVPKINVSVLVVPDIPCPLVAVLTSAISVQEVPFQDSTS